MALSVAVGFILLIACANLANVSLARAAKRGREMGVRIALGAGRRRLVRQLIAEAAVLSVSGGLLGPGTGWAGARLLWSVRPAFLQNAWMDPGLDARVCLFCTGLSLLSCLLFGTAPILRASAPDLSRLMNGSGRGNGRVVEVRACAQRWWWVKSRWRSLEPVSSSAHAESA